MKKSIFALALGASLLAVTPAFAATHQFSTEVDNNITTGDVSITLEEFELDNNGNLIPYKDGKIVMPNQKISKVIKITNEAEPAWIRAKAEFISRTGIDNLGQYMLGGISDSWIKRGDYFYYTKPVDRGEAIHFFEEVVIPPDWDETYSEKGFSVDITAQAIQKVNFDPSFESEDPWFGIPIEECVHTDYEVYHAGENTEFTVVFENGVDGFIKVGDDFFKNFSAMMPGDTMTDSFIVGNKLSRTLSIKFRTEVPDNQSEKSIKLLSDLTLTINRGNEVLYTGPLSAEALNDSIIIADLKHNETETITYSIYMPKELQNASAMQHAKVRWIFSTEYTTSYGGNSGGGGSSHSSTTSGRSVSTSKDTVPIIENIEKITHDILPKTGDERVGISILLAVMLISGSGIFLLISPWKRKKRSVKENLDEK